MRKNLICLVLILIMLCLTKLQAEEFLPSDSAEEKQAEIDKDIEALKRKAQAEIAKEETAGEKPEEKVFRSGGLSLQALNPEISVTGEMIGYYNQQDGTRKHSEFNYRGLGLHFESYLDPYSKFKAAVPVNKNIATLGEAYFTRFGLFKNVNLTLGKFRQQFGVVNRWHKHGLDQVDFPLPLRMIFGNGGLNQIGISADWIMPKTNNFSQELTVQMTNGENGRLFEGNTLGRLSFLAHYKNYRDITKDTYLEFGLTGLLGWNDEWEIFPGPIKEHERHHVFVAGVDFTLLWEPTERMRYRNLVWRTEAYFLNKNILQENINEPLNNNIRNKIALENATFFMKKVILITVNEIKNIDFKNCLYECFMLVYTLFSKNTEMMIKVYIIETLKYISNCIDE